jgi:3-oxoacyl-[acyl-carrier-protein] synthase-3
MTGIKIVGSGSYVPDNIVHNDDLSKFLDTNDEWISSRTGIINRRISTGENTSDLATKAAKLAIEAAKIEASDIDMIIVATITPDMFTPSTACIVQKNLGIDHIPAFDVSAACTGFIYALSIATQFITSGVNKRILIIGAEVLSKILDWEDRSTCVLFGDGAAALILEACDNKKAYQPILGASGEKGNVLECRAREVANPYKEKDNDIKQYLTMDGREVFKFATGILAQEIEKILENNNLTLDDIAYIIPHQANYRIIQYVSKKLKIDVDKFYMNMNEYGNTSAASIPIAVDELSKKELIKKGDKLLLIGFGGGLTYGSAIIEW